MNCLLCNTEVKVKYEYPISEVVELWGETAKVDKCLSLEKIKLYHCGNCSLEFFDPKLAGDDAFYSELGKLEWYYKHPGKTEYDYVQKYFSDGLKVLDIGSGRGVLFSKTSSNIDYTGLELSTKAVELAKADGINVVQENLLTFANEHVAEFDVVCLFQVMEHLTEIDAFIESISKVLKPGGKFVLAVPNNEGFISYSPNNLFNLPPHHTIWWKESSIKHMANKFSFNVLEVEKEPLQSVHMYYAYTAYMVAFYKKLIGVKHEIVDSSKRHQKLWKKASKLLATKGLNHLLTFLLSKKVKHGQSIIVTLTKR